jgi:Spy/CpxP family protein refolding chaperone
MKKTWIGIAALAAVALAVTVVVAGGAMHHGRGHGHGPGEGLDWFVNGALDDLQATDAQRAKVLAVKDRLAGQVHRMHGEHEVVHAAFLREWKEDKMDVAALHTLVDSRLEELRSALHQTVDGVAEIHDTLTPDQRQRLVAKVQEMHGPR